MTYKGDEIQIDIIIYLPLFCFCLNVSLGGCSLYSPPKRLCGPAFGSSKLLYVRGGGTFFMFVIFFGPTLHSHFNELENNSQSASADLFLWPLPPLCLIVSIKGGDSSVASFFGLNS